MPVETCLRRSALLLALVTCGAEGLPADHPSPHAVILVYHHVSHQTPVSTSVTPEVFEAHLDYLARQGFSVLPLGDLLLALRERRPLPSRSLALTFDDAYASVHREALPRLERRGWPFTVFVPTDSIDRGYSPYMSWKQLRDLEARGGTVGNHTATHAHLIRREPGESDSAWRRRVRDDIARAQGRLEEELDHPLKILAYPYGEFHAPLEALVEDMGYVGLGQQSGPVGPDSSFTRLPRFPVATGYDDLDSLAEKLHSRPLPATVLAPASRIIEPGTGPPALRLRMAQGPYRRAQLACFVSGQGRADVDWQGDVAVVRAQEPLPAGRSKYNCTAPSVDEPGVFYWYSHLWIRPNDDGSWSAE